MIEQIHWRKTAGLAGKSRGWCVLVSLSFAVLLLGGCAASQAVQKPPQAPAAGTQKPAPPKVGKAVTKPEKAATPVEAAPPEAQPEKPPAKQTGTQARAQVKQKIQSAAVPSKPKQPAPAVSESAPKPPAPQKKQAEPKKPRATFKPVPDENLPQAQGPPTLQSARDLLSLVVPDFKLPEKGDPYVAAEIQRRRARLAASQFQVLEKSNLEPADRAELQEMKRELTARLQPILIAYLRALDKSLPQDFRGVSKAEIQEYKKRVATGIKEAEYFLENYPQAPQKAEIQAYLARLLLVNSSVYLYDWTKTYEKEQGRRPSAEEVREKRRAYFGRILQLVESSLSDPNLPPGLKPRLEKLKGDALVSLGRRVEAAKQYIAFLRTYPNAPEVRSGLIYINAGQQFLYAEQGAEAEKILREGMQHGDKQEYFPHLVDFFYKSLTATGKLEEAVALWEKWGPVFVKRGADTGIPQAQRNAYRLYGEWYLFRLGYLHFALGHYDKAESLFQEHLDRYVNKKDLSPATRVYLQRSSKLLEVLRTLIGKEAPPIDLGSLWAFNKPFDFKENLGKVIAVCFRSYNSTRVHPALKYLQRQYEKYSEEAGPFAPITVAYLKGSQDPAGQLLTVEKEMKQLGLTYPGGLDPTPRKEIFRAYDANVGSATLIFIDPAGRIVYYEQDPRPNAFGLFTRVIERLLAGG